jgi:hypothetical protein
MSTKKDKEKIEKQFKFLNVLPVDKNLDLNLLCLKYFDADHCEPYLHAFILECRKMESAVMEPICEDKYFDRTSGIYFASSVEYFANHFMKFEPHKF